MSERYFINNVPGNIDNPDYGLMNGSYSGGYTSFCDLVRHVAANQSNQCGSSSTCETEIISFFSSIQNYENCADGQYFDCGDFVVFYDKRNKTNTLLQSLIKDNERHPDDRGAWKSHGTIDNILKNIFDESGGHQVTLPYWEPCNSGGNCASVYNKDVCVIERIPNGKHDSCGNPLYDELIFTSLENKNTDQPSIGAAKTPPTWDGPYTDCEYFNRPVTVNKNGDLHYPGDSDTRLCSIGCNEIDNKGIVWKKNADNKMELTLGQIGVDRNGKPVMAGACLVTCNTAVTVTAIDDSKPGTTSITLSDGTVISGPEVDNDVKVSGFSQNGGQLTITMTDGSTFTTTLPATSDGYVTAISINNSGMVTLTRNNGLPQLTAQIVFPAVAAPSITNLGSSVNNETGEVTVTSSDGTPTKFRIDAPEMFPSAWVRVGTTNNKGVNGDKPPNVSLTAGKSNLFGGFGYNAAGHLVVPKNGVYNIMYRVAVIGQMQGLYPAGQRCVCKLMIDSTMFSQLIEDDHSGTHIGEELNDFREHIIPLDKGATISISTAEETATHWLDAYDIVISFQSGK